MTADALRAWGARVLAGRDRSDRIVAIRAFKPLGDDAAELKSMHCALALRSQGVGRASLAHLRAQTRAAGLRRLWLETGSVPRFAAARALCVSGGFVACDPFGDYTSDPSSIFMTCEL